jgi:phosphate transport system protein
MTAEGQAMTKHFRRELESIKKRVLTLGSLTEDRVRAAVKALEDMDGAAAADIVRLDYEVDEMEVEIEEECLKVLALHQPVAVDLRFIIAVIKINNELERIGDQAVNIAESVLVLIPQPPLKPLIDIPRMAAIAEKMIRDALDAFVKKDAELARDVLRRDDEVDELKDQVFRELLTYMMADPGTIQRALSLILISRNLERIADHATNIAEDVIFIAEAKDVRHNVQVDKP